MTSPRIRRAAQELARISGVNPDHRHRDYEKLLARGRYTEAEMRAVVAELKRTGEDHALWPLKEHLRLTTADYPYGFLTR